MGRNETDKNTDKSENIFGGNEMTENNNECLKEMNNKTADNIDEEEQTNGMSQNNDIYENNDTNDNRRNDHKIKSKYLTKTQVVRTLTGNYMEVSYPAYCSHTLTLMTFLTFSYPIAECLHQQICISSLNAYAVCQA